MPPLQFIVVAGEASGDQHAAALVAEIRKRAPDSRFFGMGGVRLAQESVDLLFQASELSVMGVAEVVPKLRRILHIMGALERAAARRRPDCAILVDIPDFNLRLARRLKRLGVAIVFFISPKVWAWRLGRIEQIADVGDLMLCILPFEEPLYRRVGMRARYVGNPVMDQVPATAPAESFRARLGLEVSRPTLALLPGSRPTEVRRILPAMLGAARELSANHPGLQIVLPAAPGLSREEFAAHFRNFDLKPLLIDGQAPLAVGASDVAVVASGTATLESALMRRPFVVVYRMASLTYLLAKLLVKVDDVALVNLLAGRRVVPELLQWEATPKTIAAEVERLWASQDLREKMLQAFDEVRAQLEPKGAAARAASEVIALLRG
jgi:lipid-A-disaccharide synthase